MESEPVLQTRTPWAEFLIFLVQVVAATCCLGLAIDLVTANVAVEYFTIHHPKVVDSESPWVMALIWGVGASWWFGLIAGCLVWFANTRRAMPLTRKRIFRMIVKALIVTWVLMMLILVSVYFFAGFIPESSRKPNFEHDRRLMAVALAHLNEYAIGGIACLVLMYRVWRLRD
jgi:hypothetical protein